MQVRTDLDGDVGGLDSFEDPVVLGGRTPLFI
jgi:hypothetical protein